MSRREGDRTDRAGLAGLLVSLVASSCFAASASAEITNVQAFDGTDTETLAGETIRDDEDVHAYVTSPSGGEVCIHPSVPAGVAVSCDDAGTWAKKDVGPSSPTSSRSQAAD